MRRSLISFSLFAVFALVSACNSGEREPPKTNAASMSSAPAMTSAAPSTSAVATSSEAAKPAGGIEGIGVPKYAVCEGQGSSARQLAPAFLNKMPACDSRDIASVDTLAELGGNGKIVAATGDCQFASGISCHFHTSMEFVNTTKVKDDEQAVGEVHCIVPSTDANSPTVYGAHVRCRAGTASATGTRACSSALLGILAAANCHGGWKCCDNGTLTKPLAKQSDAEKMLRPDFRICQDESIEIDCGLFHEMHGHTANVAGLGEAITGKFNAGDEKR